MQRPTLRVKLQDLLREACASLSDRPGAHPSTVPVVRTSEDRSRMLQQVYDELARRKAEREMGERSRIIESPSCSQHGLFDHIPSGTEGVTRTYKSVASDVRRLVAEVYRSMFRVASEDYVIITPTLNAEFIARCRLLGATTSEYSLNKTLLNLRKAGWNTGLCREAIPAPAREAIDQCSHASEMAASIVQRQHVMLGRDLPSVDHILCDPELRHRFDTYVTMLLGDADPTVVRFALLAFRKSGRASAKRLAEVSLPERSLFAPLKSLDPDDVSSDPGIYRITCRRRPVFVASTLSLRSRVCSHLQHGGAEFLPNELPFGIDGPLSIEIFRAPRQWKPRRVDAIARAWSMEKHPPLNMHGTGMMFSETDCLFDRRAAAG